MIEVLHKLSQRAETWRPQTWSDVVVRIRLNPDAGITNATMAALHNTGEITTQDRWPIR